MSRRHKFTPFKATRGSYSNLTRLDAQIQNQDPSSGAQGHNFSFQMSFRKSSGLDTMTLVNRDHMSMGKICYFWKWYCQQKKKKKKLNLITLEGFGKAGKAWLSVFFFLNVNKTAAKFVSVWYSFAVGLHSLGFLLHQPVPSTAPFPCVPLPTSFCRCSHSSS